VCVHVAATFGGKVSGKRGGDAVIAESEGGRVVAESERGRTLSGLGLG